MHVGKNLNARSFFTEPIERLFSSLEKQHERNRVRSEHNAERNNCYLTNPRVMPNLLTVCDEVEFLPPPCRRMVIYAVNLLWNLCFYIQLYSIFS
jgi:hypothetical protein